MTEQELQELANKIVTKMMRIKTVEDWFAHVEASEIARQNDYDNLSMSVEDDALGEAAKLMTLMNLFQEREEFEKCAIVKRRLDVLNEILRNE
tara:strand:- start:243 stop:521 length:279 start_codon:yes stop_codon:yes gene_type:complete